MKKSNIRSLVVDYLYKNHITVYKGYYQVDYQVEDVPQEALINLQNLQKLFRINESEIILYRPFRDGGLIFTEDKLYWAVDLSYFEGRHKGWLEYASIKDISGKKDRKQVHGQLIILGSYLFSIAAELEDGLNESIISKKLKDTFETKSFALSSHAFVSRSDTKRGIEWPITDPSGYNFIIRKENGKLSVYLDWPINIKLEFWKEESVIVLVDLLKFIRNETLKERELEEERKRKLQLAKTYETSLRYEDAAKIYEKMELWEEAGRVRRLAQKATGPQISGERIHIGEEKTVYSTNIDDHSVRDSVIQRSTIDGGISQKKISICPYCGEKLNFPETPRFCPYCEKQIVM